MLVASAPTLHVAEKGGRSSSLSPPLSTKMALIQFYQPCMFFKILLIHDEYLVEIF